MDILDLIEEKKIKRWLGVRKRIIVEGGIYHIIQRAPGRELIFLENSDYLYFLRLMKETSKKFNIEFICFCLMPNHLHFLLRINESNLSLAMKNIFERYANYFNKKYARKGHVFYGRYRDAYCDDERYFLAISVYIHLNPLKAGLCRRLDEYRWSSIIPYIKKDKKTFLKYKRVLSILSKDMEKARQEYNRLLKEAQTIKYDNYLNNPNSLRKFILNFTRKTLKKVKRSLVAKGKVTKFVNKKSLVLLQEESGRKYLIQQLKANGLNKQEIAKVLGVSRWTIYRILQHI